MKSFGGTVPPRDFIFLNMAVQLSLEKPGPCAAAPSRDRLARATAASTASRVVRVATIALSCVVDVLDWERMARGR